MKTSSFAFRLSLLGALFSCACFASEVAVVPNPLDIQPASGEFAVSAATVIRYANPELANIAKTLAGQFEQAAGLKLKVESGAAADGINLALGNVGKDLTDEGYILTVTPAKVEIRANSPAGVFYGVQTLRQMLPPEFGLVNGRAAVASLRIPCATVKDAPRFRWRNLMIDSARMFPTVEMMKRYIDLMAYYKMNMLHWHLTDDHGWRIEIKKYPELTKTGAFRRRMRKNYGGFYSQDEVRDIVKYAADRYITIVPEFDLPGHATAAIASYPEFGCTGEKPKIPNSAGIYHSSYCPGNPKTAEFIRDVLSEFCELFPGPFIHIGGDECEKKAWQSCPKCQAVMKEKNFTDLRDLHNMLIMNAHDYLKTKNKRIIAWDEVCELKNLPSDIVVQVWRDRLPWHPKFEDSAKKALANGNDVIVSPWNRSYLCYPHASLLPNRKAYEFDPMIEGISDDQAHRIFGTAACLWTDMIFRVDLKDLEKYFDHYLFPRLLSHAETGWSARNRRDWVAYQPRLERQLANLSAMGVTYGFMIEDIDASLYRKVGDWDLSSGKSELEFDVTPLLRDPGMYAFRFEYKSGPEALRIASAKLESDGKTVAEDVHSGSTGFLHMGNIYYLRLKEVAPGAKYTLKAKVDDKGRNAAAGELRVMKMPPMSKVGEWSSATFGGKPKADAVYALGDKIAKAGTYQFKFIYIGGNHATLVNSVELLENGRTIGRDEHQASCGAGHENNTYTIELPAYKAGAKYELKVNFEGKGGTSTSGIVWMME